MNLFKGMVEKVSKINTATRTGAIDVVFVEQQDGSFHSTPFHVRFGKVGIFWSDQQIVDIEINGSEVDLSMVLDDNGTAYFCDNENNVEANIKESSDENFENNEEDETDSEDEEQKEAKTKKATKRQHVKEAILRFRHGRRGFYSSDITSDLAQKALSESDLTELEDEPVVNPRQVFRMESREKSSSDIDLAQLGKEIEEEERRRKMRKTRIFSRDEMDKLGLVLGENSAMFSITTKFQGTYRANCNIHVWQQHDKIVISDIDGTITRSDVRGMLLPYIGASDWAQGEVVKLYNCIADNDYRILYLSARSISQAADTKTYLESLTQDGLSLPPGPLFLNPSSLFEAGRLEVIEKKPEVFKIDCLSCLRALFSDPYPFFAGYGNRPNDVTAYLAVGIPRYRIFLINKSGVLSCQVSLKQQSSYSGHSDMVTFLYPPKGQRDRNSQTDYWTQPLPSLDDEDPILANLVT